MCDNDLYKVAHNLGEVDKIVNDYEVATTSSFTIFKKNKWFSSSITDVEYKGHRVWWEDSYNDEGKRLQKCDNSPFIIVGFEVRECQNGPDRNTKKKQQFRKEMNEKSQADHSYNTKGRALIQDTKKMRCPARILIKRIIRFPGFKIENPTAWKRKQASKNLRKELDENPNTCKVEEYHVILPCKNEHQFHLLGEFAGLSLPVGEEMKSKIKQLVNDGVSKVSEMKRHLKIYAKDLGVDGIANNRRFHPTDKDIRNHMDIQKRKFRFSKDDQLNIESLVDRWKVDYPADHFFLRTCVNRPDDKLVKDGFLFVHQSSSQKRLLNLYGNEICLLDATYNTSKYDLPLYFVCVYTNTGYINVASFISSDEVSTSIAEALKKIQEWNQDWDPQYFMTDNDASEIAAIGETFPNCQNYLCEFHREQAWDRWLKKHQNGCSEVKKELLDLFRLLANSTTLDDYHANVLTLTNHHIWRENAKLRNWFEPRWLGHRERWVRHFKDNLFNIKVTTNNGLERQHLRLKKNYLADTSDTSLSSLLSIIVQRFVPESYDRYIENNIRSMEGYRAYADKIPKFLHNRPRSFISHCLGRIPPAVTEIPQANFTKLENNIFQVQSVDSDNIYTVNLNKPECSCMDFRNNHLPCKHILSLITNFSEYSWEDLPTKFRNHENFVIDQNIFKAIPAIPLLTPQSTGANKEASRRKTVTSKLSKCVDAIKKIETNLYNIDEDHLEGIFTKLQSLEREVNKVVPVDCGLTLRSLPLRKGQSRPTFSGPKCQDQSVRSALPACYELSGLSSVEIDEIQVANNVQRIWRQSRESGYIVAKVNGINITDSDIRSIGYNSWLTDQVIDGYLGCLSQWENDQGGNTYCIPQTTLTRILNGEFRLETTLQNVHLLKFNILFGAYHQNGNHWTLLVVEPAHGRLYFYNSMGETEEQQTTIIGNWRAFIDGRIEHGMEAPIDKNWCIISKHHSKQNDSHSCGVFTLIFAERHLSNAPMVGIGDDELESSRKRIASKLLMFEVYLKDCCPHCGFNVNADHEKVTVCILCERMFHQTPFCVGDENLDKTNFHCVQCQLEDSCFGCTSGNEKTSSLFSSPMKRKRKSETDDVTVDKTRRKDSKSSLEICLDILVERGFEDTACDSFLNSLSILDWTICWNSIVDIFLTLSTLIPRIKDKLIPTKMLSSLGHFGDGYIDLIPRKFHRSFVYPAKMEESGSWSFFKSISILFYGDETHLHLIRLQTLNKAIMTLGKDCDNGYKKLIKFEMEKDFSFNCSTEDEDSLVKFHLKFLPEAMGVKVIMHQNGSSQEYSAKVHSRELQVLAIQEHHKSCISFLPLMEGIFLHDRSLSQLDKCGCHLLCQGQESTMIECEKCQQKYHISCMVNIQSPFHCGCHILRPYTPNRHEFYTDEDLFFNTLSKIDIKKLCKDIKKSVVPSFRWSIYCSRNLKKKQQLKDINIKQFKPSEEILNKLSQKIIDNCSKDVQQMVDVFLPEVLVHLVMEEEKMNRYQAELFLQEDITNQVVC